ncbi:hypothetical protein PI23P_02212 [Polaribacter irgensii 23-P]|uniref:Tetratricopeptide repeat protein n=1 Tax=Polaribacter irgensii 23-P TaxID=313594 RepID=A4BWC9_9FLAO|nr:hypothetical protein [Polaribacter irgensii]EAR13270.1 hypothetical protein PI23P_02212 [Polaribacter irgensii 23-P]
MKIKSFLNLLGKKPFIKAQETLALKAIVDEFPYFQTARVLYLKGLKNQDSFKYNNELKVTAAFTADRTILFNYITSFDTEISKKGEIQTQNTATVSLQKTKKSVPNEAPGHSQKPHSFSATESHSFHQWLQLATKKTIVRNNDKPVREKHTKEGIINTFIQNNPKITPLEKGENFTTPISKNKQDNALMTETLASVYLAQKKYENAIQAYKILSLKYPEKSGFFANEIKKIQILQKK